MHIVRYAAISVALAVSSTAFAADATVVSVAAPKASAPVDASQRGLKSTAVPLEIKLTRQKVVIVDGKQVLQDATTAKPGDELEDVATYTNKSAQALLIPNATLPVPLNTELILNSIKPSTAFASIDGINYFALPLKTKTNQANGVTIETAVAPSAYRFLRWYPEKLPAKQSVAFSARFKVNDDTTGGSMTTIVKR